MLPPGVRRPVTAGPWHPWPDRVPSVASKSPRPQSALPKSRARPLAVALALALSLPLGQWALAQAPVAAPVHASAPAGAAEDARSTLDAQEWAWRQQEFAREKIDGRWQASDRMPSIAPQDWERRAGYWKQVLEALDAISPDALSPQERINAAVFRSMVEADYNSAIWRTWEAPFNSDSFFWGYLVPRQPYAREADWERLFGRLRGLPGHFDQHIANMRQGLARGWSVP